MRDTTSLADGLLASTVYSRYLEPSREIEKGSSYREVEKIAGSKEKKSFYCIVNILVAINRRNVK